jgi:hypothetical protein
MNTGDPARVTLQLDADWGEPRIESGGEGVDNCAGLKVGS